MPFTIRPDAAQAMQEDEAQLISAITQVAQRVPAVLRLGNNNGNAAGNASSDDLRIKMGRRLVYGQLADGPFRHELDANSLKVISDAIQRPVTPDIDSARYANKVPAIEIFQGDVLLFREERDGVVTTNEIQFQVQQENPTRRENEPSQDAQNTISTVAVPIVENSPPTVEPESSNKTVVGDRADQILRTASYLMNPLRQQEAMYDAVSIGGYQIKRSGKHLSVSQGDRLILFARSDKVMSDQLTEKDWSAFSKIQISERLSQSALDGSQVVQAAPAQSAAIPNASNGSAPSQSDKPYNLAEEVVEDPQAAALSVLDRETRRLPEGATRRLLQETIQDWKRQAGAWISRQLRKGMNWLRRQQSAIQNQRLAGAVQQLFQRGHERTGEHSYQLGGCTINREGQNLYVLKDSAGELMKFKASNILGFGRQFEVLSVSDRLTTEQRQGFLSAQADSTIAPKGSLDTEATYARKTRQVENTTRQFLESFAYARIWDKEGGQFKLEVGDGDLLRITDKQDGRGIVFQRQNSEVFSKLGGQDFSHFERLANKMETMAVKQESSESKQPESKQVKKPTAIEMD